jgi:surface antigen
MNTSKVFLSALVFTLITFISTTVCSEPPSWAPAHGYRNKHKNKSHHHKRGYDYYHDEVAEDIGIFDGICKYEKIGSIVGAAAGGVIGAKVTDKEDRVAGVLIGTIAGVIVGKTIGKVIDDRDRNCAGHALAYLNDGESVSWLNPNTNAEHQITSLSSYAQNGFDCKQFVTTTTFANGRKSSYENDACLGNDGVWRS